MQSNIETIGSVSWERDYPLREISCVSKSKCAECTHNVVKSGVNCGVKMSEGMREMFAIIKTGGKQYRVVPGQSLIVEKLDQADGSEISFEEVLCVGAEDQVHLGEPFVKNALVTASLVRHIRGEKLLIFKKKRRHNYRRKNGHRQPLSLLKIQDVALDGKSLSSVKEA